MAFTEGQLYFAFSFLIIFIIAIGFAYKSDLKGLTSSKKDARNVLIFIVVVMVAFFVMIKYLGS